MNPSGAESADLAAILDQAIADHRCQRLGEAAAGYQAVLQIRPDQADALHLLGLIAHQEGRIAEALERINRAIQIKPETPEFYNSLGAVRQTMGDKPEAVHLYLQAIQLKEDYLAPYYNLLRLQPQAMEVRFNLGCALHRQGKWEAAVSQFQEVIRLQPDHIRAYNNLGCALRELGRLDDARGCFDTALRLKPDYAQAHNNLGLTLQDLGASEAAVNCFQTALLLEPDSAEAHYNLGRTLHGQSLFEAAVDHYRQALHINPHKAEAFYNWGCALDELHRYPEAIEKHAEAIRISPGYVEAHVNRAMLLLLTARYPEAWREYEWRKQRKDWQTANRVYPNLPAWDGTEISGATILVQAEQGFGDTLQFARFLPMVKARCAKIILETQPELIPLLKTMPDVDELIPQEAGHIIQAHYGIHLMSLGGIFNVLPGGIPCPPPYIQAPARPMAEFQKHIPLGGIRIGIVWSGNPAHPENQGRSCSVKAFARLTALPPVRLFSLQKGPAARQLGDLPPGTQITDLGPLLHDFGDTAAAIMNLDLIISVDTALVHLAGALGRPVWTLRYHVPYWVWGLEGPHTPWYPSMRVFRQPRPGDWAGLFQQVAEELQNFILRQP